MITVRCLLQRSNPIYMPLPLGQRYSTNADLIPENWIVLS